MSVVQFSPIRGMTILFHDVEPYSRHVIRRVLADLGTRFIEPDTGSADLSKRCLAIQPDILVLTAEPDTRVQEDLIIAIRNGQARLDREMRIVATTKCAHLEHIKHLMAIGSDAVLLKPLNGRMVQAQMERVARERVAIRRARAGHVSELHANAFGPIRSFNSR